MFWSFYTCITVMTIITYGWMTKFSIFENIRAGVICKKSKFLYCKNFSMKFVLQKILHLIIEPSKPVHTVLHAWKVKKNHQFYPKNTENSEFLLRNLADFSESMFCRLKNKNILIIHWIWDLHTGIFRWKFSKWP